MLILVLVCINGQPCDIAHARAYQQFRAPPGFVICSSPGSMPLQNAALLAQDGEETHIRCRVGDR